MDFFDRETQSNPIRPHPVQLRRPRPALWCSILVVLNVFHAFNLRFDNLITRSPQVRPQLHRLNCCVRSIQFYQGRRQGVMMGCQHTLSWNVV